MSAKAGFELKVPDALCQMFSEWHRICGEFDRGPRRRRVFRPEPRNAEKTVTTLITLFCMGENAYVQLRL